jgi:Stage II sporulation protein E (SpoIIE)
MSGMNERANDSSLLAAQSAGYAGAMLPRTLRIVALVALLSLARLTAPVHVAGAEQAQLRADAPLVLTGLGRATVPLDGLWQFHPGDDLRWASPQFDDSGWASIQVGKTWEEQGYRNMTGFAWYRRHIVLGSGDLAGLNLALYLRSVDSACEVYWNGRLVGGIGKVPPDPVWYFLDTELSAVVPLGPEQSGVLAIRVWRAPVVFFNLPNEGGLLIIPQAGTSEAAAALQAADRYQWLRSREFLTTVARLSAIAGVLALLFWLGNRQRTVLIWLALAMFFPLERFYIGDVQGAISFRWGYGMIGILIGINDMALWLLLIAFLGLGSRKALVRWTWILIAILLALESFDGILQLFDWTRHAAHLFLIADIALTIPTLVLEFWGVVLVVAAFRERLDAARWTLAISVLLTDLVQAVDDITGLGQRWTHWTIASRIDAPLVTLGGSALNFRTITNTCMLLSIIYVAWRYSTEQTERQVEMEQEFRNARELQQFLIPVSQPETPGFAITSAYRPAREVGGDFFQILPLDNGSTLIVLGDVSGKGLKAAMAVSFIVGALRALVDEHPGPADLLTRLNRRLSGRLQGGFATCLALRIAPDGRCTLAGAGHPAPLLNGCELALPGALPLGITDETQYSEIEFALAAGDHLAIYTDGLLEARSPSGELYGFERVGTLFATGRDATDAAEAAVSFGQDDDITVLTLVRQKA